MKYRELKIKKLIFTFILVKIDYNMQLYFKKISIKNLKLHTKEIIYK